MNRKTLIISLLTIALTAIAETSLIIKPLNGEEQAKALTQIGYVKVSEDSLFVYSHSDYLYSKSAIKDIQHIRYGEPNNTPTRNLDGSSVMLSCRVYPNPAQDILILENANCEKAHVFDLNGHLLQSVNLHGVQNTVNVSSLPIGEYILMLNNQTYKFIKQ